MIKLGTVREELLAGSRESDPELDVQFLCCLLDYRPNQI